jgi:translation initiation factor IF-1
LKDDLLKFSGKVDEVLPGAMFRIILENQHKILATLGGKLRQNKIQILLGDKVDIEMSPYDITRGRVIYRHR